MYRCIVALLSIVILVSPIQKMRSKYYICVGGHLDAFLTSATSLQTPLNSTFGDGQINVMNKSQVNFGETKWSASDQSKEIVTDMHEYMTLFL